MESNVARRNVALVRVAAEKESQHGVVMGIIDNNFYRLSITLPPIGNYQ